MRPLFQLRFPVTSQHVADLETAGVFQNRENKIVLSVLMLCVL